MLAVVIWLMASAAVFASNRTITVTGTVDDAQATVTVNQTPATVAEGTFSANVMLTEGLNTITATATDKAGNRTSVSAQVTLDLAPPVITITAPRDGQVFGAQ